MALDDSEKPKKKNTSQDAHDKSITIPPDQMADIVLSVDITQEAVVLPPIQKRKIIPIEVKDRLEWTEEDHWQQPKWLKGESLNDKPNKTYRQFMLTLLRSRYWRMEGDFRTFYNNYYNSGQIDFVVARRLIDTLQLSKKMLENENCDLVGARDLLGVAEQYLVSLYPEHIARERGQVLAAKLTMQNNSLGNGLVMRINAANYGAGNLSALLSEITDTLNQQDRDNLILNSLQVSKLENLVQYGKYALFFLLLTLPFILKFDPALWKGSIFEVVSKAEKMEIKRTVINKPVEKVVKTANGQDSVISEMETTVTDSPELAQTRIITESGDNKESQISDKPELRGQHWKKWLVNLAVAILGGVGAFFSGLMGIRKNKIQLADYEESMTNYGLRVIIGAIASMILFVFISWEVVPGVTFTNAGGILFVAFLAGFSESFFLKKLGVDDEDAGQNSVQSSMTAPAAAVIATETTEDANK